MAPAVSRTCRLCSHRGVELLLDFGQQPFSNRFPISTEAREERFRLALSVCPACGLLQLDGPPPAASLRPRVDWIAYNEAEGHLDDLVARAATHAALAEGDSVIGISYKDTSTVERFQYVHRTQGLVLDPLIHLDIRGAGAGIETIQAQLTPDVAQLIVRDTGRARLVVCRHILEHAQDLHAFAHGLHELVEEGGWVLFEVPDFSASLATRDYSTLWEEHASYFTPATFTTALERLGFAVVETVSYPYALENSFCAIAQRIAAPLAHHPRREVDASIAAARTYAADFESRRQAWRAALSTWSVQHGPIVIFGAGHLAAKFVNLLGLADLFWFVVDDHPKKKGLFMPGSKLPILGTASLYEQNVRACLSSLNPWSEPKALERHAAFIEAGGQFASMFPASPRSLLPPS